MARKITENHKQNSEWQIDGLSPAQIHAALLQSQGMQLKRVASECGVTAWTINSWNKIPEYKALINSYLRDTIRGSQRLTLKAQKLALQRLMNILADPSVSAGDAIAAARIILSLPSMEAHSIGPDDPGEITQVDRTLDQILSAFKN